MYRAPQKQYYVNNPDFDFEQALQAYEQGYEARRLGKAYNSPWRRTQQQFDACGNEQTRNFSWEDELFNWYYNGFYDWTPGDWVPYLKDEQQGDWAVNPKTGKARKQIKPGTQWPQEAWNWPQPTAMPAAVAFDLNAVIA